MIARPNSARMCAWSAEASAQNEGNDQERFRRSRRPPAQWLVDPDLPRIHCAHAICLPPGDAWTEGPRRRPAVARACCFHLYLARDLGLHAPEKGIPFERRVRAE